MPPAAPSTAGTLMLDASSPIVTMSVGGQAMRLRIDPAQSATIELDPGVAATLRVTWTAGRDLEIGRVRLQGKTAPTMLIADGRSLPVLVSTHGRPIGEGADGLIGPDLLPYAAIHWRRADAPPPTRLLVLPMTLNAGLGLVAVDPRLPLPIRLRFSFAHATSEATAAAGSLLAQRFGGRFEGVAEEHTVFLGIARPERRLRFDRPPTVAGFQFGAMAVRISDFRGANPLPADRGEAGDIIIARREPPQPAQSWVTIGRDQLDRCADVAYTAQPRSLTLACAFD